MKNYKLLILNIIVFSNIAKAQDSLFLFSNPRYVVIKRNTIPISDIDGNYYKTLKISSQTWMEENLNVTKYNDGTVIQSITDRKIWGTLTTGAVCTYNNTTNINSIKTYGRLYNWYAVHSGKLCPKGWHVPSDAEWTTLENNLILGGYNFDGSYVYNYIAKSMASKIGWNQSITKGAIGNISITNNSSNFNAIPGGGRGSNGEYDTNIGNVCFWWTSTDVVLATEESNSTAWGRYLNFCEN